jgi:predicted membrane protein
MKMNCFFFSGIFWGAILILLGISVILRVVLGIHFPIFRLLIAILVIYFGIRLLIGAPLCKVNRGAGTVMFKESRIEATTAGKYDIVFGKGVIDLTDVKLEKETVKKEVNTVFGAAVIKINPEMPVKIVANSAFASTKFQDGNIITFGKYTYATKSFRETEKHLLVETNAVFGSLEIVNK